MSLSLCDFRDLFEHWEERGRYDFISFAANSAAQIWGGRVGWMRKIFSFPVMCMFLLALVIFSYAPRGIGLGEPDIWWRLRSAADFLQHHALSRVDTYSFTAAGSPWTGLRMGFGSSVLLGVQGLRSEGMLAVYAAALPWC